MTYSIRHSQSGPHFWHDPALPFVESRRACNSRACYKPHSHPTFSIGAVDGGTSIFTGAPQGPITLHPGTLVFVPASHVHACNPAEGRAWSYQMLHLDAAWLQQIQREHTGTAAPHPDASAIRIQTDPIRYTQFCALNNRLFSALDPADKEAALIEFIGDHLFAAGTPIPAAHISPMAAARIQPILDYMHKAPVGGIALDQLARIADVSRYQLIRDFRAVTGMTPHAWQVNRRINLAREHIRAGQEIAAVAYDLGFADQAHFQRVFKAYAGTTPGQFRT